ncbi:hypothetical protein RYZ26_03570 [Terasakiella sp. A23]|uniref:DUF6867 family protein n=1 Tax=Terasakiella sp. FCG-A23 TaxID=3080561 RepID=UPI0029545CFE|nr:hypothetical protein [Terasakiella sp. A23]MDV7338661.1 hypothetical protein [Terasakiella sp. A23]
MESITGVSLGVFLGLTCLIAGFCAYMTGQALASTWRPMWQIVPYMVLLGLADRFLTFALFEGPLLSLQGYLVDTAVLLFVAILSYLATRASKMVSQYPWQYKRAGLFGWKEINE